ncbi:helix-turn-helix domain-containing protein [Nocardioides sp. URHA0020]|uniref:helix-turn-helix domain-containing protein n=1 Tax=Nocardioides sp. URHA0020 TaxID=1380392 RepID=UPI003FA56786
MPYPSRPVLDAVAEFRGSATTRPSPEQRRRLLEFVAAQCRAGRSLREIAELADRTQSAVRRILDQAGVPRRGQGAPKNGRSCCPLRLDRGSKWRRASSLLNSRRTGPSDSCAGWPCLACGRPVP